MANTLPQAQTLHWNATEISLLCPYCSQPESVPYEDHSTSLFESFCGGGQYIVSLEADAAAWSIDKSSGRLISAQGQAIELELNPPGPGPRASKIDAVLQRPAPFPEYTAQSGLKPTTRPYHLDGTESALRVREVAQAIRHRLPTAGRRDQRIAGLWSASHAVKKLAVKFLDMHIWLPDETAIDTGLKKEVDQLRMRYWWSKSSSVLAQEFDELDEQLALSSSNDQSVDDAEEKSQRLTILLQDFSVQRFEKQKRAYQDKKAELDRQQTLAGLVKITPSESGLRQAIIATSEHHGPVCNDCRRFVEGINSAFGVGIMIQEDAAAEARERRIEAHL